MNQTQKEYTLTRPFLGPPILIISSKRQLPGCTFLNNSHLIHFYITVLRPVLEYCVPLWHYALIKAQSDSLEAVQKRVPFPYHSQPDP